MPELLEIVDVKVEAKVFVCDLCAKGAPGEIHQATKPHSRGPGYDELPAGALVCNNWSRPEGWEEIGLPGFPRRIFCGDCAPVVAKHLDRAFTTVRFPGFRK